MLEVSSATSAFDTTHEKLILTGKSFVFFQVSPFSGGQKSCFVCWPGFIVGALVLLASSSLAPSQRPEGQREGRRLGIRWGGRGPQHHAVSLLRGKRASLLQSRGISSFFLLHCFTPFPCTVAYRRPPRVRSVLSFFFKIKSGRMVNPVAALLFLFNPKGTQVVQ